MKKAISKVGSAGLVVVLLVSWFSFAAPALAVTPYWSVESIPGAAGQRLGPAGVDVRDMTIAADGTTIYAVAGDSVSDNVVYKSADVGVSWAALDIPIEADLVAVAPDDAGVVAVAGKSASAVCITTDGGLTWSSPGVPQESGGTVVAEIHDIAISAASAGIHYVAVAGEEMGDVGNVWYFGVGAAVSVWKETSTLPGFGGANAIEAVAFSPDFPSDKVVVAVSEKDNVSVNLEILSLASMEWNSRADFTRYPVTIISDNGITDLVSASISLAPAYHGGDATQRIAFVGLTVNGDAASKATSGIYRLIDTVSNSLMKGANIHSIGFNGTNLVAGVYDSNIVYRSTDPLAATPNVSAVTSMKEPGGESRVVVGWAGSAVVAGTSGNESAFAISGNNGQAFNDISLIDTATTNVRDVAVSTGGDKVYLITDDGADLSLWRRDSNWERILSRQDTIDYIVRIAPDNYNAVFLAKKGTKTIYSSKDGGQGKWFNSTCGVEVQDLAVESAEIVYALSSEGSVSKSVNAGSTWLGAKSIDFDTDTETEASTGNMIISAGEDNVLVGSANGYVAYSLDGGASWAGIPEIIQSGAARVQVVADKDFATNKIIYAASDSVNQNIMKWTIGGSTAWADIFSGNLAGGVYGLAVDGGILYALEFNARNGRSTMWQCLVPTAATKASSSWSSKSTTTTTDVDDTIVRLNATPQALKVGSGKLWAVKTNGVNKLYSFTDILTNLKLGEPAMGFTNPVNPVTGTANEMVFSWSRAYSATEYKLYIAYDENFTELVTSITVPSLEPKVVVVVGPGGSGDARVNFMAGTTYYWRVGVTQPFYSLYSEARSFTITSAVALIINILSPENGSAGISRTPSFSWEPISGATKYRFLLADNVALASPIADVEVNATSFVVTGELDYSKTYYWMVKAVVPVESDWSVLANFTVMEPPVEPAPPIVVETVPPPIIQLPEAPPPTAIIISPAPEPLAPVTPSYIWAIIIVGVVLVTVVVVMITRTYVVETAYGGRAGKLKESLPVSFAAKAFLWMKALEEKEESGRVLSIGEEQALGEVIVSRIKGIAMDQLLYHEFPKDAALLLYLWAHYGSRDETNRYLSDSFLSGRDNVTEFLKCYLHTSEGLESDLSGKGEFTRTQYDEVVKVVDPENIVEAIRKRYGRELNKADSGEFEVSLDKAVAFQFLRVHRIVKNEPESGGETKAGQS